MATKLYIRTPKKGRRKGKSLAKIRRKSEDDEDYEGYAINIAKKDKYSHHALSKR